MAMTSYTGETEIITNIGTTPDERGLSTAEFKAKFDEGLKAFVAWFNDTHKTEFDAHLAEIASDTDLGHVKVDGETITINENGVISGSPSIEVETGTWTPTFVGSTSPGTNTYTTQVGHYTKIGSTVILYGRLTLNTTTMSGNITIDGLPFVAKFGMYFGGSVGSISAINFDTDYTFLDIGIIGGNNKINMYQCGDNKSAKFLASTAFANGSDIIFSITYETEE